MKDIATHSPNNFFILLSKFLHVIVCIFEAQERAIYVDKSIVKYIWSEFLKGHGK